MKIKELEQHCENCILSEYCADSFSYCICDDDRFSDMDVSEFKAFAETDTDTKALAVCEGCERPYRGFYIYGGEDCQHEDCEHRDDAQKYFREQIAEIVRAIGREGEKQHEAEWRAQNADKS
jgi:hypothetical protein